MDNSKDKSSSSIVLRVLCNPDTIQNIAITCKCGTRVTYQIPKELHDSQMIVLFECPKCDTQHLLRNHKLTRISEEHKNDIGQTSSRIQCGYDA